MKKISLLGPKISLFLGGFSPTWSKMGLAGLVIIAD